jgi:intein-encoded DNA endonuclease-like protein
MILKIRIKQNKKTNKNKIIIWIQKQKDVDNDIKQLLNFFKDQLVYYRVRKIHQYYKVTSGNPAIMMSLISSIQDLIPEIYFNVDESIGIQKTVN